MADPPLLDTAADELTSRLLDWSSTHAAAASENSEDWKRLRSQIRTTTNGVEAFKRATKLLSGEEGCIVFQSSDATSTKDPQLIVRSYFRLLRLSLEPAETESPSIITENEWTQFTKTLLKNLGSSLKSSIQRQIQHLKESLESPNDKQGSYNRSSCTQRNNTILLYFHSIIDHVVPHVRRKNAILGSTYKLFSEIAELFVTLLELECNKLGGLIQSFLPVVGWTALSNVQQDVNQINETWDTLNICLKRAILSIVETMDEGMIPVQRALEGEQSWSSKPEAYSRIIVFMMARAVSLIFLRRKRCQMNTTGVVETLSILGVNSTSADDGEADLISQCLQLLMRIRSISVIARGCLEDASTKSQLDENRIKLFEMLVGLGQKVDFYVIKLLCLDADGRDHGDSTRLGFNCLANLPSEEFKISLRISGDTGSLNESENVFPLGKLSVVKHVLENLNSSAHYSPTSLIQICQSTIFQDLPKWYHLQQKRSPHNIDLPLWASIFICDLVGSLIDCSRRFFLAGNIGDNSRDATVRQHQLLIRWLAGSKSANHPFTNEIIMCILQTRATFSNQDRSNLLSLMAKLLFHPRTESSHRNLIATVLSRLIRPSGATSSSDNEIHKTKLTTIQIMWRELKKSSMLKSPGNDSSGKRKRNNMHSSVIDDSELYQILELLAEASVSSQGTIDSAVMLEVKQLWNSILACNAHDSDPRGRIKIDNRKSTAMSLLAGLMRGQPNTASLHQMINGQDIMKSVSPRSFIDGSMKFIDSIVTPRRRKGCVPSTRLIVCVQFISSLATFLGSEFSETHMSRLGRIIDNINSASQTASTLEKVRVQHHCVWTCCRLGPVIKPNCSAESVKVCIIILYLADISP